MSINNQAFQKKMSFYSYQTEGVVTADPDQSSGSFNMKGPRPDYGQGWIWGILL